MTYVVNHDSEYNWRVPAREKYAKQRIAIVRLLTEERKRRGISKYQIEQKSGVSQQMVGYVERGEKNPSLETILRIADGISADLPGIIELAVKESEK